MRGSAIERGDQNQQWKLDGIVTWSFDRVIGSSPLMLQAALLLLGCAISRYLWKVNSTIVSVVIGATLVGIFLYLFIMIVGTASESCQFQTPGAIVPRYIVPSPPQPFSMLVPGHPPSNVYSRPIENMPGLRCISWMFQMSLNRAVWLATSNIS